jgi:hypothetical protein
MLSLETAFLLPYLCPHLNLLQKDQYTYARSFFVERQQRGSFHMVDLIRRLAIMQSQRIHIQQKTGTN